MKYKGKERRERSRYPLIQKANLIIGSGQSVHTVPVELRSIGVGGALVRILGAFARDEYIIDGRVFILTITGDGPITGITASVVVKKVNQGAYNSKCVSLAFEGENGELEGDNRNIFMRWRRPQTAIGRKMQSPTPRPY